MKVAIYPGSFDPITFGHMDIIERACGIFDKVILAVAESETKKPLFTLDERLGLTKSIYSDHPKIETVSFSRKLTVELAREHNDANVLCIPARFVTQEVAIAIVDAFVNAEFEGGRHQRRVGKICCSLIAFFITLSPTIAQTDYASRIDSTGLYDHLKVFSSDDFEGR